jgi:formate--tetrahydrofolate ligase
MGKSLLPIQDIARKLQLPERYYEQVGPYGAKLKLELLEDPAYARQRGKLVLVSATTPTVSGEGKTVTAIGLVQGLERIGKRAVLTSREPSLGPVFGMKGGAAGAGLSQVEPSEKINLHFHGDFHAITSAHNLLAAMVDAHIFHGNDLDLDPERVTWPRAMDMNDRALRQIVVGFSTKSASEARVGANRRTGFVITAASEIMAILALARDREDLRRRLASIVVGASHSGQPVRAAEIGATGAMMALLQEALLPNLVQTTEGAPAFVHAGPFGNIAHGTSSVLSQQMGLRLADYVINEVGFATDLGAEKYIDIVMRSSGTTPAAAVLVTTAQSLRNQGEGDLERGLANLAKHISILRGFGLPVVVAVNHFPKDTPEELERLQRFCAEQGAPSALAEAFTKGGAGAMDLARALVETIDKHPDPAITQTYALDDPLKEKINKIAKHIYGAAEVQYSDLALEKLATYTAWGHGNLPICMAKTQYSLSDNPKLLGAPTGWALRVTDVSLSAGAGFLVVIAGNMMLMPGLPKAPRAFNIDVDASGEITGMV